KARMLRLTQLLCLLAVLCLCQALTTPKPKTLVQPTPAPGTTTGKPKQQQATQWKQDAKCLQPLETGPCRMSLDRFYYNKDKKVCEPFKYGGCKGNDNRWGFRQMCEEACVGKK
ncbi:hypothetical protein KR222_011069, partial [Zaprionus bogoriensis]